MGMGGNRELLDGKNGNGILSFRWEWERGGDGNEVTEMGGNWDEKIYSRTSLVHTLLQLPLNLVVDWVKVRTVGWPQSWGEVWCFMSQHMRCLTCSVGWTPKCLTAVCNAILKTEIFCRQYLNINNSCNMKEMTPQRDDVINSCDVVLYDSKI